MNKHGQTLVLFIILIPIVIAMAAIVVDVGYVVSKKTNIKEVTKTVIKDSLVGKNSSEIETLLIKNSVSVENLEVIIDGDKIQVKNSIEIDSIFGQIIGIKNYNIKINIIGYEKDNKVVYEYIKGD